jgi:hypothetical protein
MIKRKKRVYTSVVTYDKREVGVVGVVGVGGVVE